MLDLDRIRYGKLLEVMDTLALDTGHSYMKDAGVARDDQMYFNTIAMTSFKIQHASRASRDFSLTCYPVASSTSTLTVRADLN
jgi:hypothetical protein